MRELGALSETALTKKRQKDNFEKWCVVSVCCGYFSGSNLDDIQIKLKTIFIYLLLSEIKYFRSNVILNYEFRSFVVQRSVLLCRDIFDSAIKTPLGGKDDKKFG